MIGETMTGIERVILQEDQKIKSRTKMMNAMTGDLKVIMIGEEKVLMIKMMTKREEDHLRRVMMILETKTLEGNRVSASTS